MSLPLSSHDSRTADLCDPCSGDASGPFSLALSGATFLPIQQFSDRAEELIKAQEARIAAKAATLPPGLKEQYEVQLEMLKKPNVPDIEILVFPFSIPPNGQCPRDSGSFCTAETSGYADSGKPYTGVLPSIGHPFSRGTIVRYPRLDHYHGRLVDTHACSSTRPQRTRRSSRRSSPTTLTKTSTSRSSSTPSSSSARSPRRARGRTRRRRRSSPARTS